MNFYMLPAGEVRNCEIEIKRSRFLSHIARVDSLPEARAVIGQVRAAMPDARHHCTAFIVPDGDSLPISRSSDDGEPSGTAGRPMLDVLEGVPLVGVVAVVTRYFGGTLLGTGGLVRAYSQAVREGLEGASLVRQESLPVYEATFSHQEAGRLIGQLSGLGFAPQPQYLADEVKVRIATDLPDDLVELVARLTQGAGCLEPCGREVREVNCAKIVGSSARPLAQ